ncbi:MAG: tetratricopeptide repeat protein [Proteobacteria bacterium]|nr:tetratricopeptide repeat protein [Pseudomonadota bacterium]
MAVDDQEEYEQGEQLRKWLRANGASMIGGIAIGLALIYGWKLWQQNQDRHAQAVAQTYGTFASALDDGANAKTIATDLQQVRSDGAKTTYAVLAALRMAAHQVDGNDAKAALATLDGIGKVADPALGELVQLRAARVLLILNRPGDALKRVDSVTDPAYAAVSDEVRGDAQRALGHLDQARDAYARALANLPEDAPGRGLLAMKLTEVGGVVPKPEDKKA